jgi:DNA-binding transcriptional MerR regulator
MSSLRIGPIATMADLIRLYGVTPRALRFYEERGLITARRDRLNQRFYDGAARSDVELIARLRRLGVGLAIIREILEVRRAGDAVRAGQMILGCLATLQAELERRREDLEAAFEDLASDRRSRAA